MARKMNIPFSRRFLIAGCWITAALLVGAMTVLAILTHKEQTIRNNVRKHFTVEAGSKSLDASMFLFTPSSHPVIVLNSITREQLSSPGNYQVVLYWQNRLFEAELTVADTIPPSGKPVKRTAIRDIPDPKTLVADVSDFSDVTVTYVDLPDMSKAGTFPITVRMTDRYGNYRDITSELTVMIDTAPPVISCSGPITVSLGNTVDYCNGVTVADNLDPAPVLTVDASQVNLDAPGTYAIVYMAADASGNISYEEAVVHVVDAADAVDVLSEDQSALISAGETDDPTDEENRATLH